MKGEIVNEWIHWNGGEMPVDGETVVEVKLSALESYGLREATFKRKAKLLEWNAGNERDIIAYRIVEEKQKPINWDEVESVTVRLPEGVEGVYVKHPGTGNMVALGNGSIYTPTASNCDFDLIHELGWLEIKYKPKKVKKYAYVFIDQDGGMDLWDLPITEKEAEEYRISQMWKYAHRIDETMVEVEE